MKVFRISNYNDLKLILEVLKEEAIIDYSSSGEFWEFYKYYLEKNYSENFTFHYSAYPGSNIRATIETPFAFNIKPKICSTEQEEQTTEIKNTFRESVLFDIKNLSLAGD